MLRAALRALPLRARMPHPFFPANAQKRTRTSTGYKSHQHLKLARLPIPPPGLVLGHGRFFVPGRSSPRLAALTLLNVTQGYALVASPCQPRRSRAHARSLDRDRALNVETVSISPLFRGCRAGPDAIGWGVGGGDRPPAAVASRVFFTGRDRPPKTLSANVLPPCPGWRPRGCLRPGVGFDPNSWHPLPYQEGAPDRAEASGTRRPCWCGRGLKDEPNEPLHRRHSPA